MKRFLLLCTTLIVLVALPVSAQDTTPYADPDGLFTAEIPAGWTQVEAEGYALFENADSGVTIGLLALPTGDKDAALEQTWALIDPSFDGEPLQTTDLPLPGGVIWTQYVYVRAGALDVIIVQAASDTSYVMTIHAPTPAALQPVTPDVNSVLLSITTSDTLDLSGVSPAQFDDDMAAALTRFVDSHLDDYATHGISVAVVQDGEVVYAQGFGETAQRDGQPVTADTLFMIGSTTKSMTTLLAAMLVDEGIWDWDDLVVDVYPDFELSDMDVAGSLRVRDLFNMSSGIPRYDFPLFLQEMSAEEILADMVNIPITAAPGEAFQYSNQMVAAGGYLAALAAGGEFGDLHAAYVDMLTAQVFEPLGMANTTASFETATTSDDFALPYAYNGDTGGFSPLHLEYERFTQPVLPAGGVWSSANDMAQYMIMELNGGVAPDGTRIVSEESLAETQVPEIGIPGDGSYGMGWMIQDYKGLRHIEHGGNTGGFTSTFGFLPDAGIGVVVLANRTLDNTFGSAISEYVYEEVFDLEHSSTPYYQTAEEQIRLILAQVLATVQTDPVDLEAAQAILGTYERGLTIAVEDGELVARVDYGPMPLFPLRGEPNTYTSIGIDAGTKFVFTDDSVTLTNILGPYLGEPQEITLARVDE
ncbi:MAG: beta-lactamase family protein [Anaerolineae bacterium]|nr:beta-lactamase family protein [Anaerolineae bacterium]